jgi:raffinose/stachyose/melibiose transport system substrate-binding protein
VIPTQTGALGVILALNPQFKVGLMPSPADKAADTRVGLQPSWAAVINATITPEKKAAALKFIDFIERPKQTETFDKAAGLLLSGFVLKTGKFPTWAQPYLEIAGPLIKKGATVTNPQAVWPNAGVTTAMYNGFVGLLTGQKSIDQTLADMDTAFNLGSGGGR